MSKQKIQMTLKQAKQLLADIPDQQNALANHLSDDEFIGYGSEVLTADDEARIETHLAICSDCATKIEWLLEAAEAGQGEGGVERLAAQRTKARAQWAMAGAQTMAAAVTQAVLDELRAFLDLFSHPIALSPLAVQASAPPPKPVSATSTSGRFSAFVREMDNGNLAVRLASQDLTLEGKTICFYVGEWQRLAKLQRVAKDYLGLEILITRAERLTFPPNTALQARVFESGSPTTES